MVVGMMLERVAHRSVANLLQTRIVDPTGRRSSTYATRLPGLRSPHLSEYAVVQRPDNVDPAKPSVFSCAGEVVSTAPDLDRFYRALFTGRLLRMGPVRDLATPRTPTDPDGR